MTATIEKSAEERMQKSIQSLEVELSKIRTGRANVGLLDHVEVDYYGSMVPISQAANVSVSDFRSLTIQVWESEMVSKIEKAILTSDLGLTPNTAGQTLHINLPPLTEERRKEMVKIVRSQGEQAKVAVRNIRRDANNEIAKQLSEKAISEDDQRRAEANIQKLTDKYVEKIEGLLAEKEKELMEI